MKELNKILHVDDDGDIREIARMALELVAQMTVHQCSSGKEALEQAEGFQPDLFLLDVMMPEMSGEETWRKLLEIPALAGVPAIFMTAKAEASISRDLRQAGAIAVITKPFDPMTLGDQIREAWAAHSQSG